MSKRVLPGHPTRIRQVSTERMYIFGEKRKTHAVCSETMISVRVRNSVKRSSVFAADRCSVGKIQVPGSGPKRTVFAADRCSVAKNGAKRAQT